MQHNIIFIIGSQLNFDLQNLHQFAHRYADNLTMLRLTGYPPASRSSRAIRPSATDSTAGV
jgi:hypothetical protein